MSDYQIIKDYLRGIKAPLVECNTKDNKIYYLDIEKHKFFTYEELLEIAKKEVEKNGEN